MASPHALTTSERFAQLEQLFVFQRFAMPAPGWRSISPRALIAEMLA